MQSHKYPFIDEWYQLLSRSKKHTIESVVARVLLFAVVGRRGSTEMEEARRINKQVLKKGLLLQPEGRSRAEGTD